MGPKILIVDDSIVFRSAISKALSEVPEISEIKTANNGKSAVELVKSEQFDLITLDIEMPVMDGLQALKEIRLIDKNVAIIIFSAISPQQAKKTIDALQTGANDFLTKSASSSDADTNIVNIRQELLPRIFELTKRKFPKIIKNQGNTKTEVRPLESKIPTPHESIKKLHPSEKVLNFIPKIVTIGSSTGGPEALKKIFTGLRPPMKFPLLIVQHMPPVFTDQLAKMLSTMSEIQVKEAQHGEKLIPGQAYIAPGDFHMKIANSENNFIALLEQTDRVCFVRPSVDVLFNSVASNVGESCVNFVLTGMGDDGMNGSRNIRAAKGKVIIQDKESSVVWGMPGMVFQANAFDKVAALSDISEIINKLSQLN